MHSLGYESSATRTYDVSLSWDLLTGNGARRVAKKAWEMSFGTLTVDSWMLCGTLEGTSRFDATINIAV